MNFLIIGFGSAGQRHARVIRKHFPNSKIDIFRGNHKVGLISQDLLSVNNQEDPIVYYLGKEIFSLDEIAVHYDILIVATPIDSHKYYVDLLWDKCNKILIEKPIALDLSDANSIANRAIDEAKIVLVGYQHRFSPLLNEVFNRFLLNSPWDNLQIKFSEFLFDMNPFRNMMNHHLMNPKSGNAYLALSHEIDFMFRLFPNSWRYFEGSISSSNSLNQSLDTCAIEGEVDNVSSNQTKVSVDLSYSKKPKNRTGFLEKNGEKLFWDLNNKTLVDQLENQVLKFDFDSDYLIEMQIKYLISSDNFDLSIKNYLQSSLDVMKLHENLTVEI